MTAVPSLAKVVAAVVGSLDEEWQEFASLCRRESAEATAADLDRRSLLWTYRTRERSGKWIIERAFRK